MTYKIHLNLAIIAATLAFIIVFLLYETNYTKRYHEQFQHHATVIQNALWNLDKKSPVEYLTLAAQSGSISQITVLDKDGSEFLHIPGPSPSGFDRFFLNIGLIEEEFHSIPIKRAGQEIGYLNLIHSHKSIYFHLYITITLLLCLTAYVFFLRTLKAKRNLEARVRERTLELASAMKAVQESEEKFRAFAEQTVQGIMAFQENRFIYCNNAAADIFSAGVDEVLAWQGEEYLERLTDDRRRDLFGKLVQMEYGPVTWGIKSSNDGTRWIESLSRKIHIQGRQSILIILNDITERKQIEEQLRQREKMDSVGELAGGIAHDFNNMLGGILGAAEILGLRAGEKDPNQKQIKTIVAAANRATDLISKLLAFSRKGMMETRSFDAHNTVKEVFSLLSHSLDKRIKLFHEMKADSSHITGDPSQIQNAILNLAVNARDAMDGDGEIIVTTNNVQLDEAYCVSSPYEIVPGNYLEISIKDNGHGIRPENINKIFDPFFTTKEVGMGTGLGLSAVYGTVKDHKGAITVYSEEGEGTIFHLYLPISKHGDMPPPSIPESQFYRGEGTVLVVDDEEVIRNTAKLILNDLGYDVILAADGAEGVEIFKANRMKIRLVLLDMVMPKMNGPECHRLIRELSPDTPVLLCSGFTGSKDIDELLAQGASGFIKKPYNTTLLSKTIAGLLNKQAHP